MTGIKLRLNDDIRRVSVPSTIDVQGLRKLVNELYGALTPSSYALKYEDEDSDLISIRCQADLTEAAHVFGDRTIVIHVVEEAAAASPAPVVESPAPVPVAPAPTAPAAETAAKAVPENVEIPAPETFKPTLPMSAEDFFARLILQTRQELNPADLDAGVEELRQTGRELLNDARERAQNSLLLAQLASLFEQLNDRYQNLPPVQFDLTAIKRIVQNLCERFSVNPEQHFAAFEKLWKQPCGTEAADVEISAPQPPAQNVSFESDITLRDGVEVFCGDELTKIWRVRNSGTDMLRPGNKLVLRSILRNNEPYTNLNIATERVVVPQQLPGASFDVILKFSAPLVTGRYRLYFRLTDSTDYTFGDRLWVDINVVPPKNFVAPLAQLAELGFNDEAAFIALQACEGNTERALELLLASE